VNGQVHRPPELADAIAGDTEFPLETSLVVKDLDSPVACIGYEDFGVRYGNAGGVIKLPRTAAFFTPGKSQRVRRLLIPVDRSAHPGEHGQYGRETEDTVRPRWTRLDSSRAYTKPGVPETPCMLRGQIRYCSDASKRVSSPRAKPSHAPSPACSGRGNSPKQSLSLWSPVGAVSPNTGATRKVLPVKSFL